MKAEIAKVIHQSIITSSRMQNLEALAEDTANKIIRMYDPICTALMEANRQVVHFQQEVAQLKMQISELKQGY